MMLSGNLQPIHSDSDRTSNGNTGLLQDNGTDDLFEGSVAPFEIPLPTPNGGFTHTAQSKAKISAANKGKAPWNKGQARSDDVRAKIAAGVRAANRMRFLQQLQALNLTEAEWEHQRAEEQRRRRLEQQARRTAKGGYRPTPETKAKISKILKEKYANGEVKRREISPDRVRRGFSHSPETRAKISASLRQRWANDETYRSNMVEKSLTASNSTQVRQKISQTLKLKWQDPEFRAEMLQRMASKRPNSVAGTLQHNAAHRQRISDAMKAKWQDEAYRQKTLESIAKRRDTMMSQQHPKTSSNGQSERTPRLRKSRVAPMDEMSGNSAPRRLHQADSKAEALAMARPMEPLKQPKKGKISRQSSVSPAPTGDESSPVSAAERLGSRASRKKPQVAPKLSTDHAHASKPSIAHLSPNGDENTPENDDDVDGILVDSKKKSTRNASPSTARHKHGNVDLLREERRDLYDLLYGDDDPSEVYRDLNRPVALQRSGTSNPKAASPPITAMNVPPAAFDLDEDENLENFDPYGLDDF